MYPTHTRIGTVSKIADARNKISWCIIGMAVALLAGIGVVAWQYPALIAILQHNRNFNSFILAALGFGVIVIFLQARTLLRECHWLNLKIHGKPTHRTPNLLASMQVMFDQPIADVADQVRIVSIDHSQSMLDGISIRLDAMREIPRYMVGVLVFLGLLGTFWGLLQTISSAGSVVAEIDLNGSDFNSAVEQLRAGLNEPLQGMGIAFSSSLFGLGGSLILGFLDLLLGQAIGRFYANIEDWLASITHFGGGDDQGQGEGILKGAIRDARVADANLKQALKMVGAKGKAD